jgi:EAL domain-containing protein (putative c-di-GMP-specific phosphodiesterase class I)
MTAELDAWVLGTLADMRLPDCGLNVNLCAGTLSGDDALVMVDALLRAREGGPGVLVEVPEAAATRSPRELERLGRRLAERGGQLAVDDFGVNVAGLRAIERAPVSLAKLDAELTRQLVDNHGDRMVVEALIRLGHGLGWQVAIKCIPDEESLKAAIGLGARFVQGFHVAPPLTAEEASEFVREPVAALAQHAGQA